MKQLKTIFCNVLSIAAIALILWIIWPLTFMPILALPVIPLDAAVVLSALFHLFPTITNLITQ